VRKKMKCLAPRAELRRRPVLRAPGMKRPAVVRRDPRRTSGATDADLLAAPHLGAYAPLIGAIREELEHFVASYLRLHLAIAERDRYLLTSIDVQPTGSAPDDAAELVPPFTLQFEPEQIKRYLAQQVTRNIPNA